MVKWGVANAQTEFDSHILLQKLKKYNQNLFYAQLIFRYKSGYHINWKGEKIHYRSKNINYDVETLKIQYYDTQKKKFRIAIPDIYIKDNNEIVEIKSKWTLDEINMNDKIKSYKKLGYNVKLLIGEGNKNFFKNSQEIIY